MPAEGSTRPHIAVEIVVNGQRRTLAVEPRETLADIIRDRLALTGTKVSCDAQVCGSCTVLLDDLPVSSCTTLAADADGRSVLTVEGLASANGGALTALQQAFLDKAAFQCGFCTPGFLMAATALLNEEPAPTRARVIEALEGNICRCTGYEPIVQAVLLAGKRMRA